MMNNGDGNRVSQRFQMLKERQDLMHRRYMDKWSNLRERETQEINHTKQFMRAQPPTANNKNTSKNKPFGSSNKLSNSNANTEQSNLNNTTSNNNKSVNFHNAPSASAQQDHIQSSQKRTYDQFNGTPSSNEETLAKASRVSEQTKQFINSRNNSSNAYDVNSNLQPNMNLFQTNVSKEKPNLTLPVSSMNLSLTKNTVTTPQVVKYVEKLLEQSDDLKLQNSIKVEPSNTQSSNDPGFDESIRFYGEYLKTDVKTENEPPSKSDTTTQIQTQINNQISNTNTTQNLQTQPSPQQQNQQKLKNQSNMQTQQMPTTQMSGQPKISNQQPPIMNQTPISNHQQMPNQQNQQQQWQNNIKKPGQNPSAASRNFVNRSTQQQAMNITTPMQILSRNMGNSNAQMMGQNTSPNINQQQSLQQQMPQPSFSNNSTMMNSASMNLGVNTNTSMNNPNANMMNSNNMMNNISSSMSTGMMQNNNTQLTTQPPSLPRLNQTPNTRLDRVLPNKDVNQGPQMNNQQYIPQQNHVGSYTNGKLQDMLKRRQMKLSQQHPMSNQIMHPLPQGMQQNSFMYNNDVGMTNQQQLNNMQPQQNGMAFFPPPYPMDNSSNQQLYSNNTGGYFPQNPNKPAGKMLQEFMGLSTQRQMNGMYNMHQNMNQQQMFSMNNKAPPQYNTQMRSNIMNQATMMNMNPGMNTSARLTHFSQPDSNSMVMSGPPGIKNQLGMNMNTMNRYPPPLSRNMMQANSNLVNNSTNQLYDGSYMNPDMNNFPNMGNNTNTLNPEQMMIRAQLLRLQRQQQQQQLLSQQQHHQQQNMNYPPIMNSEMQQMLRQQQQQQQHPQQISNPNSNTNSNTNNNISTNMQQQYTANQNYVQQSSNSLQGNLQQQTAQMQQQQQHTPQQTSLQQQTQQNSSLYSQSALDNSTSIGSNLNSSTITDTSASLLETSNTDNNEPGILPDDNSIDEILENPSDQFDLISILSHE